MRHFRPRRRRGGTPGEGAGPTGDGAGPRTKLFVKEPRRPEPGAGTCDGRSGGLQGRGTPSVTVHPPAQLP